MSDKIAKQAEWLLSDNQLSHSPNIERALRNTIIKHRNFAFSDIPPHKVDALLKSKTPQDLTDTIEDLVRAEINNALKIMYMNNASWMVKLLPDVENTINSYVNCINLYNEWIHENMTRIYDVVINDRYLELLRGKVKVYWKNVISQLPKIIWTHQYSDGILQYYKQQMGNIDQLIEIFNYEETKETFVLKSPHLTINNYTKQLAQLKIISHKLHQTANNMMQALVEKLTLDDIYVLYYPEHLNFMGIYQEWHQNLDSIVKKLSVKLYTGMMVKEVMTHSTDMKIKN